jgi:Thioredoxin-like proteins and domains
MTDDVLTVKTEATPNPNSLKYKLGRLLIPGGSAQFPTPESAAERSPLASRLFEVDGVTAVFIGADFFTITRAEGTSWQDINEGVAPALEAFFEAGEQVLTGAQKPELPTIDDGDADPQMVETIKNILDDHVRPAVAMDGGDIIYRGFKEGVVYLELYGACSGCPSSTLTLKQGVETMIRRHCPDVISVEAI